MTASTHKHSTSRHRSPLGHTWDRVKTEAVPSWGQLERKLDNLKAMPPVELWLVRHGETTTNARGLVTGTSDSPLTPKGRKQAREASAFLAGHDFEIAWSSTLRRSKETLSEILSQPAVATEAIREDTRLDERALGELELAPARPIAEYAEGNLSYSPRGGESYESVAQRCLSFLIDVTEFSSATGHGLTLLVCSHVGPMRIMVGILERMTDPAEVLGLGFENSAPKRFEFEQLEFPRFVRRSRELHTSAAA
jgi:probable phosphoglycerate mutase